QPRVRGRRGGGRRRRDARHGEGTWRRDAPWKKIQQNTFTRWCNEHLKCVNKSIGDLQREFGDGLKLISLLEVLSQKKMYRKQPRQAQLQADEAGRTCPVALRVPGQGAESSWCPSSMHWGQAELSQVLQCRGEGLRSLTRVRVCLLLLLQCQRGPAALQ
ncbi:hypothetical protein CRUP_016681, partial [Coryphaenoides rupestris]